MMTEDNDFPFNSSDSDQEMDQMDQIQQLMDEMHHEIIQIDNQKNSSTLNDGTTSLRILKYLLPCTITMFLRARATNKNNFYFVFVALMSN